MIKSTIGGSLRLRSYEKLSLLDGNMSEVKERNDNENPLFTLQHIARPLISEKAPLRGVQLKNVHMYDCQTQIGETLVFMGN